jgi:3D (Asp-Asp-Asp) domain-containing protein
MVAKIGKNIRLASTIMLIFWIAAGAFAFFASENFTLGKRKIPFIIKTRRSPMIQNGWSIWLKEGQDGYSNAVTRDVSIFGKTLLQSDIFVTAVLKKPVEAFVVRGSAKGGNPIIAPKETYAYYAYDMVATAYDPSPESNSVEWAGITALGWRTRYGIVAVDPRVIALKSLIYVDGYGFAWAGDTGGDIKGKRIDLCYNTTREALRWGRRKVRVYVLGNRSWSALRAKKKTVPGSDSVLNAGDQ